MVTPSGGFAGVGTVLIWDFGVAYTRGGAGYSLPQTNGDQLYHRGNNLRVFCWEG